MTTRKRRAKPPATPVAFAVGGDEYGVFPEEEGGVLFSPEGVFGRHAPFFRGFLSERDWETTMIRRAVERDIDAVERQYAELLAFEQAHGSRTNWKAGVYPTRAVAEQGVADGALYVMEEEGELRASMLLNHVQLDVYASIVWKYPADPEKVLVIHTLCVPPSQAGKGVGTRMVRFALEEAARRGCEVLRLDTWEHNEPAAHLYRRLGFREAGRASGVLEGLIAETLMFLEKRVREDGAEL